MSALSSMARARASFIFQPPLMLVMALACRVGMVEGQEQQQTARRVSNHMV
jgi:hypothetical protein